MSLRPLGPEDEESRGRPIVSPRWRRILIAGAKVLVAVELFYLVAGNLLLSSSSFHAALDPVRPGTRIRYESAWTIVPGVVSVRGFDYLRDGPTRQWALHADRVWAFLDPTRLATRTVRFLQMDAEGVEVRLRRRPVEPRNPEREALLPPIEGMTLEPRTPPPPRRRRAWRIRIDELEAEAVREVWIDTFRWQGTGRVAGGFTSRSRESATIFPSRVELDRSTLMIGSRVLATELTGDFQGHSETFPLPIRPGGGIAWLEPFSITGSGTAESVDGSSLDPFLPASGLFRFSGGGGPIAADVVLVDGTLEAGSRLDWSPERLGVAFLGYTATGSGKVHAEVVPADTPPVTLAVNLAHFELMRDGLPRAHLEGDDLQAFLGLSDRHLDGVLEGGYRASAKVEKARIPDLKVYDAYLPERVGVQVTAGTGEVNARFELAEDGRGEGRLELVTKGAALDWRGLGIRGRVGLDARLSTVDAGRRLELAGTKLRLDEVEITPAGTPRLVSGWWAEVELPGGHVQSGAVEYLAVSARARLRDGAPVEAIFAERHRLLARLARRVGESGVTAEGRLRLAKDSIHFDDVQVDYPEGSLGARIALSPGHRRGELLARWRRWAVGLAFRDAERDWVLRGAERWWTGGGGTSKAKR